jgi:HEAT repeat protein
MTNTQPSTGLAADEREGKFLADIQSENADTRYNAWVKAGEMGPQVVPELGRLLNADNPGIAKAAEEALKVHVHSAAKEWNSERRKAVMKALLILIGGSQPRKTRVAAVRHLSTIGDAEALPPVAKLIEDKNLREEAVFCLERIPGEASTQVLMDTLASTPDEFKPRVIAALGHRKDERAVGVLAQAMGSGNVAISIPAMKAVARIGTEPQGDVELPDFESLSQRDKAAYVDSWLRYLEAQIQRGNPGDAEETYAGLLNYSEREHFQCAAIVGLQSIASTNAVSAVLPKLKSDFHTVRETARKALIAMKGPAVDQTLKDALQTAEGDDKKTLEAIIEARK